MGNRIDSDPDGLYEMVGERIVQRLNSLPKQSEQPVKQEESQAVPCQTN